jgi:predicted oxidoreductase
MKTYAIQKTDLIISRIAYGCMNIGGDWSWEPAREQDYKRAEKVVLASIDAGINFFDHADIYTMGKSEEVFGKVIRKQPGLRQKLVIQTKCGIRFKDHPDPGVTERYDFSYTHIIDSVEGSLKRLNCDWIDILLLHRPDPLVEPEEVARAFDDLLASGKVRYFGVSNHNPAQIELLQSFVRQPLVVNQLELSLAHPHLINEGVLVNMLAESRGHVTGILDYCRLKGILVQAWAPVANGRLIDPHLAETEPVKQTAILISQLAKKKGVSREAVAIAWLLRHPAGIQPILGSTKSERVLAACQADQVVLSREEWYSLFTTARGGPVP